MRILLDTNVLVWLLLGDRAKIPAGTVVALEDPTHEVLLSAVCVWEIAIKRSLGKITLPGHWPAEAARLPFTPLPITATHGAGVEDLPPHHGDPFDRLLVAQARAEGAHLASADERLRAYDVPILWD